MDFWLVSAFITFVAVMVVMLPMTRRFTSSAPIGEEDRLVYLQQLEEVEADLARGLLDATSAEQARLEISRRILQGERNGSQQEIVTGGTDEPVLSGAPLQRGGRWSVLAVVLCVPFISWAIYAYTGSPEFPSQPLSARSVDTIQDRSAADLIAQAEAHLASSPDDGRGWNILAPIYMRLGRTDDAINAYRQALRLLGEQPDRLIGLSEALMVKANGRIEPEAQALLDKVTELDPLDLRPQLLHVRSQIQAGNKPQAIALLQTMLDNGPKDAPWRSEVEQSIAQLRGDASSQRPAAPGNAPVTGEEAATKRAGPTTEDIEAAAQMSSDDRAAMVQSMVDNLAAKMRDNPADTDGWKQLIRAYMVLNQRDKALTAVQQAIAGIKQDQVKSLVDYADKLGLDVSGVQYEQ